MEAVEKIYLVLIIVVIVAFIGLMSIVIIGPGQRGVQIELGKVTGYIYEEGFHLKTPFIIGVDVMDTKVQKITTDASAASKDLQVVTSTIAVNYRVKQDMVATLRQQVGLDYKGKIIDPAVQEAVKSATAKFTAEEVITKRELVREQMKANLQEKLDIVSYNSIDVVQFNVENFDFSAEFNAAIEAKVTAEQEALKAENILQRIKIEKEQTITKAEAEAESVLKKAQAEAESIRIRAAALRENPEVIELETVNRWDGVLPKFLITGSDSGSNVLLNVPTDITS